MEPEPLWISLPPVGTGEPTIQVFTLPLCTARSLSSTCSWCLWVWWLLVFSLQAQVESMGLVVTIASGTVRPMGQSLVMRSGWLVGEGAVAGGTMSGGNARARN